MTFEQFVKEWKDAMVFKPAEFDVEATLNDIYIDYKNTVQHETVKEWCNFFFADCDLDTHPYMIKSIAINTHHANNLKKTANIHRKRTGLPLIPLIKKPK